MNLRTAIALVPTTLLVMATACGGPDWIVPDDVPITCDHGGALLVPGEGELYHGVFPGDEPGDEWEEDGVSAATLESYEAAVGAPVAWVYFSHNWYHGREFPLDHATWIRDHDAVPFIRLMLRSSEEQNTGEGTYTLEAIVKGEFDDDLRAWGQAAAAFGSPLVVEWGTEANGRWFSWNGWWHGRDAEAPKRFRAAYRHIMQTVCDEGASNTTWVFHVDQHDWPDEPWNALENYYPGDDAVDWVGISTYGTAEPNDDEWPSFAEAMDATVPRVKSVAPGKPVMVLEFGVTSGNPLGDPADWTDAALSDLVASRWPAVRGFAWWNENWQNDRNPEHDSVLRVEDLAGVPEVFQEHLQSSAVHTAPLLP